MAGRIRKLPDDEFLDDGSDVASARLTQGREDEKPQSGPDEDPSVSHGVTSIRGVNSNGSFPKDTGGERSRSTTHILSYTTAGVEEKASRRPNSTKRVAVQNHKGASEFRSRAPVVNHDRVSFALRS